MKDVMIISLIIITVSLMIFMYLARKQEVKAMEMQKRQEDSETELNSSVENTVQDIMTKEIVRVDILRTMKK